MMTLVSRTYRKLAGAVVAVAIVTLGLYATDSDAPIEATLPEVEVVAEPIAW